MHFNTTTGWGPKMHRSITPLHSTTFGKFSSRRKIEFIQFRVSVKICQNWISITKTGFSLFHWYTVFGFEKLGPSLVHNNSTNKIGFLPAKARIETEFL
jgi:hypothetical protein